MLHSTLIYKAVDDIYNPGTKGNKRQSDPIFEDKEEMWMRAAFSRPSEDPVCSPPSRPGMAHQDINTRTVHRGLYDQEHTKALRPDRINFMDLRLL